MARIAEEPLDSIDNPGAGQHLPDRLISPCGRAPSSLGSGTVRVNDQSGDAAGPSRERAIGGLAGRLLQQDRLRITIQPAASAWQEFPKVRTLPRSTAHTGR